MFMLLPHMKTDSENKRQTRNQNTKGHGGIVGTFRLPGLVFLLLVLLAQVAQALLAVYGGISRHESPSSETAFPRLPGGDQPGGGQEGGWQLDGPGEEPSFSYLAWPCGRLRRWRNWQWHYTTNKTKKACAELTRERLKESQSIKQRLCVLLRNLSLWLSNIISPTRKQGPSSPNDWPFLEELKRPLFFRGWCFVFLVAKNNFRAALIAMVRVKENV